MLSVNVSDIAITAIKNVDYWCIIHNISKHEASKLLENSVLENCWYIYINIALNFSQEIFSFTFLFKYIIKWLIVWTCISL